MHLSIQFDQFSEIRGNNLENHKNAVIGFGLHFEPSNVSYVISHYH